MKKPSFKAKTSYPMTKAQAPAIDAKADAMMGEPESAEPMAASKKAKPVAALGRFGKNERGM